MIYETPLQHEARVLQDSMDQQLGGTGYKKETDREWRHRLQMEHEYKMEVDPGYAQEHREYMAQLAKDNQERDLNLY